MILLKIPIAYLCGVVWYAVRATPAPPAGAELVPVAPPDDGSPAPARPPCGGSIRTAGASPAGARLAGLLERRLDERGADRAERRQPRSWRRSPASWPRRRSSSRSWVSRSAPMRMTVVRGASRARRGGDRRSAQAARGLRARHGRRVLDPRADDRDRHRPRRCTDLTRADRWYNRCRGSHRARRAERRLRGGAARGLPRGSDDGPARSGARSSSAPTRPPRDAAGSPAPARAPARGERPRGTATPPSPRRSGARRAPAPDASSSARSPRRWRS